MKNNIVIVGKLQTTEAFQNDLTENSSDWMTVQYRCNRGIIHDGEYPHLSTPVSFIDSNRVRRRVILGFNCFPEALKECNERAPEHSETFNKTIKLYQKLAAMNLPITSNNLETVGIEEQDDNSCGDSKYSNNPHKQGNKISLAQIKQNPALMKLLISAAKIKKREDAIKAQQQQTQI